MPESKCNIGGRWQWEGDGGGTPGVRGATTFESDAAGATNDNFVNVCYEASKEVGLTDAGPNEAERALSKERRAIVKEHSTNVEKGMEAVDRNYVVNFDTLETKMAVGLTGDSDTTVNWAEWKLTDEDKKVITDQL